MKISVFFNIILPILVSAAPVDVVKQLQARAPPGVPSTSTANTYLAALVIAAQGSQNGYSRDLFPHWITQSGTCNTREVVLARDGTNVVQASDCSASSGSWYSPYDGVTWTAASDVDVDHMVPLSNAWKVFRVPTSARITLTIKVGCCCVVHLSPPSFR